jgi:hypothetical protein
MGHQMIRTQQSLGISRLTKLMCGGALLSFLVVLNLLPCVDHCSAADVASAPQFARFLCDMPLHDGAADPATPHHHHASLRVPVEPVLALADTTALTLIVTARLLRARGTLLTALLRTPPTPPPRAV